MTNREKYAKDLEVIPIEDFMVKKDGTANFCWRTKCENCIFKNHLFCSVEETNEWLDQECEVES